MPELRQLLSLEYGAALPAELRSGYGYPVFGSSGEVGRHTESLVSGPGVVVGRKGSVGKVSWADQPFWPIDTSYWVNCADQDKRWIYWLLSWLPLVELDSSTGIPGLNRNDVYELDVYEPPNTEKRLLVQILDTLDTTIRQTEAIIAKLKQVKQGLLHDLLTRGIDANGELRPPQSEAPHLYKASPLGWIPVEWEARELESIVASTPHAIVDGPFGSNLKSEHYRDHGVPVIQSGYVTSGTFQANAYFYVTQQHFQSQARSRVDPGDIVMAKIGAHVIA
jgi:type I restriction enzyme S subunit